MSAGAAVETKLEVRDIPVVSIFPSLTNPRKSIDKAQLEELAQSIRSSGIKVALSVRATADGFEIIGGERRWRAAKLAGLNLVPAIVHVKMTEDQFRDAQLLENLQRADLLPLDEAEAYQEMFQRAGEAGRPMTPADLAAKIGKSESYIRLRLRLIAAEKPVKDALRGESIALGHALELARLEPATQKKLLEWLEYDIEWNGKRGQKREGAPALQELRRHIAETVMLDLSKAPFDTKDAQLLLSAGRCLDCKKRTGNSEMLFADVKKGDTCTDPSCYEQKVQALVLVKIGIAELGGKKAVRIADQYSRQGLAKGVLSSSEYEILHAHGRNGKQDCDATAAGIYVDGEKRGQTVRVCLDKKCSLHRYVMSSGSSSPDDAKKRRDARIEQEARLRIFKAALEASKDLEAQDDDYLAVAEYAIQRADSNGTKRMAAMLGWPKDTFGYGKKMLAAKLKEAGIEAAVHIARLASVSTQLTVSHSWGDGKCAELDAVAKSYGVDAKKIRETVKAEAAAKGKGKGKRKEKPAKPKGLKSEASRLSKEARERILALQKKRFQKLAAKSKAVAK